MKIIRSRQNSVVAAFRVAVRSSRQNRQHILLDGARLIEDAHAANVPIGLAMFSATALDEPGHPLDVLAQALQRAGVETVAAADAVLRAASPVRSSSGVVALAPHRPASMREIGGALRTGLVVAAVRVQDPGNVGAIIRAADAGGASGVVVTRDSADPYGWRALRGAMGSTFRLPVATCDDADGLIQRARACGAAVVAAVPRGGDSLETADLAHPTLALVGTEGGGLDRALDESADMRISIPMRRRVDSLNVAVATALIVYEARRQRASAPAAEAS